MLITSSISAPVSYPPPVVPPWSGRRKLAIHLGCALGAWLILAALAGLLALLLGDL
jgi:hypothetical protein